MPIIRVSPTEIWHSNIELLCNYFKAQGTSYILTQGEVHGMFYSQKKKHYMDRLSKIYVESSYT